MRPLVLLGALGVGAGLALAAPVRAQTKLGSWTATGELETGFRILSGDFDSATFEEYRDLQPGLFGNLRFGLEDESQTGYLWGDLYNVGYDDQRYGFAAGRLGTFRLSLDFGELPHVFSNEARSLFAHTDRNDHRLVLPTGVQSTLQALGADAAAQSAALGSFLAGAPPEDLEGHWRSGGGSLSLRPTADLELATSYRIDDKQGRSPFSIGFGSPGGTFVSFAKPLDERIHTVTADARLAKSRLALNLNYTGSFFQNDLHDILVANPLRVTDAANAASTGRLSPAPDNSAHSFGISASVPLGLPFPATLAGSLSYGLRFQDDDFLPHTSNQDPVFATPLLDLPENGLDGRVATLLGNLVFTARPVEPLHLKFRYRIYDFDNDTDEIHFLAHTVNDQGLVTEPRTSVPNEYDRQDADLDATYRLSPALRLAFGYAWEYWSRSTDREVRSTNEQGPSLGFIVNPVSWAELRTDYDFRIKRGSDYDAFAYLGETLEPADFEGPPPATLTGNLEELRKYDQANSKFHGVTLHTRVTPRPNLDLGFSGSFGYREFDSSDFGLVSEQRFGLGPDLAWEPHPCVRLGAHYSYEDVSQKQRGRWRPRTFAAPITVVDDPRNDWVSRSVDAYHEAGLDLGFVLVPERLDLELGFELVKSKAKTRSDGPDAFVGTGGVGVGADGGRAVDWPEINEFWWVAGATLAYHVSKPLTLKLHYRFENYDLDDFTTEQLAAFLPGSNVNGSGIISPSRDVFLANRLGGYAAHVVAVSVVWSF